VETTTPGRAGFDDSYPVQLAIDYPDRNLNRLSSAFRFVLVIPIVIVLGLMSGGGYGYYVVGGGILFLPPLLMILFRQKYPRWWFDWNKELLRFVNRVHLYAMLMDDRYPSTDEHQSLHLDFPYPEAERELSRWLPLVKWFLAIPHYVVLFFLSIAMFFVVVFAWFAILFTGRYPRSIFDFVVGILRWSNRVAAYAVLLVTDEYPPFRLSP